MAKRGDLIILAGPMGARKTVHWNWYMHVRGEKYAHPKRALALKPVFDSRYAESVTLTHDENSVIEYLKGAVPNFMKNQLGEFAEGLGLDDELTARVKEGLVRACIQEGGLYKGRRVGNDGVLYSAFQAFMKEAKENGALGGVPVEACDFASDAEEKIREFVSQYGRLPDTVGIAEYQFWDEPIGELVDELVDKGVDVVVEGLPEYFTGDPFLLRKAGTSYRNIERDGMEIKEYDKSDHHIMSLANHGARVIQLEASCQKVKGGNGDGKPHVCGKSASKTQRWDKEGGELIPSHYNSELIVLGTVGSSEAPHVYGPVCEEDHDVPGKPAKHGRIPLDDLVNGTELRQ